MKGLRRPPRETAVTALRLQWLSSDPLQRLTPRSTKTRRPSTPSIRASATKSPERLCLGWTIIATSCPSRPATDPPSTSCTTTRFKTMGYRQFSLPLFSSMNSRAIFKTEKKRGVDVDMEVFVFEKKFPFSLGNWGPFDAVESSWAG